MPSNHQGLLGSPGDNGGDSSYNYDRGGITSVLPVKKGLRWLRFLMPWRSGLGSAPEKLRPTAYLDGLRGFAAFLVYWHHNQLWAHLDVPIATDVFENGFGYKNAYYLASFPGLRFLFSGGHFAVSAFFVMSGYVLAAKPLLLIQSGEQFKLADYLTSALFRRWFRLFLPLIATTFIYVTSWHVFGIWNPACEPKGSYADELWNWYVEMKNFSFLFKDGHAWVPFNQHLWSIPMEFRGSLVIFTTTLALSRASVAWRLFSEVALAFYFLYIVDGYYCALFMTGMLQCDLDMLARSANPDLLPAFLRRLEPYKKLIFYHLFFFAIYLGGVPCENRETTQLAQNPGWYWLSFLKPQAVFDYKWFYLFWAANFLVASIPRIPWLKHFFELNFNQYLGKISFSLYLVHGPILCTISDRVYYSVGFIRNSPRDLEKLGAWANLFPLPKTGPVGLEIGFLMANMLLLPLTLWVADVVTRTIDEPSVRFAAWFYKKTQAPQQKLEDSGRRA